MNNTPEQMQDRLYLFTDAFPYGSGEQFLSAELTYLADAFHTVIIIPRRYGGVRTARTVPPGVEVLEPFCTSDHRAHLMVKGILNTSPLRPLLREGLRRGAFQSLRKGVKWAEAALLTRHLLAHPHWTRIARDEDASTLLYFYWGCGSAWVVPFLATQKKIVARFHGYDLYEDKQGNNGYIPFRHLLMQRLDIALCVSDHGARYLSDRYRETPCRILTARLGVDDGGQSPQSTDGILRIVTCSRMIPLKRLDLLCRALTQVTRPVHWTHIGDGPLRPEIEALALTFPAHITVTFTGALPHDTVHNFYTDTPTDLFINVSETEGLSVSIMEALAAGIPVAATDVGGTSELVNNELGRLLPETVTEEKLADVINDFATDSALRERCRKQAKRQWEKTVCAKTNFQASSGILQELLAAHRDGSPYPLNPQHQASQVGR